MPLTNIIDESLRLLSANAPYRTCVSGLTMWVCFYNCCIPMSYNDLRKGRISLPHHIYFVTTVVHGRVPEFADLLAARVVVRELRRLHETGTVISMAWVLMPDHLHWLFQLNDANLSAVIKALKGRTAKAVNQVKQRRSPLWQKAFYDHALRRDEDVREIARYIVANPLRAGLVSKIGDYPHWDAIWL